MIAPCFQAMNDMNDDFDKSNITLKAAETFNDYGEDLQAKMHKLKVTDSYTANRLLYNCSSSNFAIY